MTADDGDRAELAALRGSPVTATGSRPALAADNYADQPTLWTCPHAMGAGDTHHMVTLASGRVRCEYCREDRGLLVDAQWAAVLKWREWRYRR